MPLAMFHNQTLSSLFEDGGDPNGRCAFLNMNTFKIQKGDCNKDGAFFFCTSGKTDFNLKSSFILITVYLSSKIFVT